ncbi:SpoIIE family protein phosphatase [Nocardioides sp.]|uniref:PP2C family protein-serine/threonine phosphatase n=1 Tax=Nocardioides sp. TaxID=35761 RepID=UPI0031FED21D|nr:histidine kinase [Nocardioides sp.]
MKLDPAQLFDDAPCGYVVFSRDGLIIEANAAFLRLVDLPRDQVVLARTFSSLVSTGGRIFFDTHLMPMLDLSGRVSEVALELIGPRQERIPVLVTANLFEPPEPGGPLVRAIVFVARDRRRYETELLRAKRIAEEARAHADALAETLQQTLIPPTPPTIEGLVVAAAYRPAGDGQEVGGDFYDVFQVGPEAWMVVLGDVCGKGVQAATVTSFVRHTVRALAMQLTDPAELLSHLDTALSEHPTDRFVTLVALRLERGETHWLLDGSAGGHPLPLLRTARGEVSELGLPGPLIGVLRNVVFTSFRHVLEPGETLTMYTDGVTEARREGELYGAERLIDLLARSDSDPHSMTAAIVDEVLEFQDGNPRDDIAIVTVAARGD